MCVIDRKELGYNVCQWVLVCVCACDVEGDWVSERGSVRVVETVTESE